MTKVNQGFFSLQEDYLFSRIKNIKEDLGRSNRQCNIIDMSIGDVRLELDPAVVKALHSAVDEMADVKTFRGYSPDQGYIFLREAVKESYRSDGVELKISEIFVNDGAKSDLSSLLDIFSKESKVGLQNVGYPVYLDVCKMNGLQIIYIETNESNNFLPSPSDIRGDVPDIIYLCSPSNPTGEAYSDKQIEEWVNYAIENRSIIFYDAAYKDFIVEPDKPQTIYQIKRAKECAIEICSLSKSAGFTGLRCGYTIVPEDIKVKDNKGKDVIINKLWKRRQATKFNGVSYVTQRGAEAYLKEGSKRYVNHCLKNAKLVREKLESRNKKYWGGINSPYIWLKCPIDKTSEDYFRYLIESYNVLTTPGLGFGADGYVRLSTFFILL